MEEFASFSKNCVLLNLRKENKIKSYSFEIVEKQGLFKMGRQPHWFGDHGSSLPALRSQVQSPEVTDA